MGEAFLGDIPKGKKKKMLQIARISRRITYDV